jgi:hypothetical protein
MAPTAESGKNNRKIKRRGFVMTGGGAKGLYEAGVIHAFHIAGMEFDVITGSSIGAMNSAFFAEYLYQKRQLPDKVQKAPLQAVEAMDPLVKAYQHAWLLMPDKHIIDDSPKGPLGKLKDDLLHFDLSLPQITRLGWWWTDPQRGKIPEPKVWPAAHRLLKELVERLGGLGVLLRIFKDNRQSPIQEAIRTYLEHFGMARALIPPGEDGKIKEIFTQPVSPLRAEHLWGEVNTPDDGSVKKYSLLNPERTLRDYANQGIELRLTRANYRTGRLEISAYIPVEDFVHFMQKQAWRLQKYGPDKIPLGSFRLQVPGNPNAINAAICSGRFPGVFIPFPFREIYPEADPENALLYKLVTGWLNDPQVAAGITKAYQAARPQPSEKQSGLDQLLASWRDDENMHEFFPKQTDTYVDGGSIDNTPSNSAVDYIREWAEEKGLSKRDVNLELFVIFLGIEPKVTQEVGQDPNLYQVVKRTMDIMGVAKQSNDTNTVSTINTFGKRGEELGLALKLVLDSFQENLGSMSESQKDQVETQLREKARQMGLKGYLGKEAEGILKRMEHWADEQMAKGLPLHVEEVKIYPEEMPLSTLQFTGRLGYRKANAIEMLTMGCYNTLWTLRGHLEEQRESDLDDRDQVVLGLARKWMDIESWPKSQRDLEAIRQTWRCQRTACVFHAEKCVHGRKTRVR